MSKGYRWWWLSVMQTTQKALSINEVTVQVLPQYSNANVFPPETARLLGLFQPLSMSS